MHSMVHTSKKVMKMCSHLLWEAAFTFYASWIGKKYFCLPEFFQNGVNGDQIACSQQDGKPP